MLAYKYNLCQSCYSSQKSIFCWKYPQILINHNLGTSHQNLKKNSGIHIDHKRNKICKNEGFLKR